MEPYNPQQNSAERVMAYFKDKLEKMFILTKADQRAWFNLAKHIADICCVIAMEKLAWRTSAEKRDGETPDISKYLLFSF